MKGLTALIIALAMLICAPVWADEEDATIYTFDEEEVEGIVSMPNGTVVSGQVRARISSLIKVRQNFVSEMFKSVEHI